MAVVPGSSGIVSYRFLSSAIGLDFAQKRRVNQLSNAFAGNRNDALRHENDIGGMRRVQLVPGVVQTKDNPLHGLPLMSNASNAFLRMKVVVVSNIRYFQVV